MTACRYMGNLGTRLVVISVNIIMYGSLFNRSYNVRHGQEAILKNTNLRTMQWLTPYLGEILALETLWVTSSWIIINVPLEESPRGGWKKKEWYCGAESHTLSTTYYDSGVVANDVIMQHQRHASQTRRKWLGWSGFGPTTFYRACPKHCLTQPLQAERCSAPMTMHSYHTGSAFFLALQAGKSPTLHTGNLGCYLDKIFVIVAVSI